MSVAENKKTAVCKSCPVIFCTPAQARALLCEGAGRTLVLLVRHGATDWNMQMRLQGRVEVPLNSVGIKQSKELAAAFGAVQIRGGIQVFTSPLSRARDTASYISDAVGTGVPTVTDGLIERDYGPLTGMTIAERRRLSKSSRELYGNVEPVEDAAARLKKTVGDIRKNVRSGVAVAVTHGGVLNALFSCITGGRAGCCGYIAANCKVFSVAVGDKSVIPLAFNLGAAELREYIEKIGDII